MRVILHCRYLFNASNVIYDIVKSPPVTIQIFVFHSFRNMKSSIKIGYITKTSPWYVVSVRRRIITIYIDILY